MRTRRAWCLFLLATSCSPVITTGDPPVDPSVDDAGAGPTPARDGGAATRDAAITAARDMAAKSQSDLGHPMLKDGPIGPTGGTVNLLHFGIAGDTRPPSCEDTAGYPSAVIDGIATQFSTMKAQFVVDLGDHMYVCNDDLKTATDQMNLYMNAVNLFGATWFMTEGNHECWQGPCLAGSMNANYVAFMDALAPISKSPYYAFDVQTSLGLAAFVVVADNSWDNHQSTWLEQTLSTADQAATYTIVARHHPEDDTSVVTNPDIMTVIRKHKFALFLSGHSHLYKHMTTDAHRDMVLGCSGAPLIAGGSFNGFAMIDQLGNGELQVTVHDLANVNAPVDVWTVGPN